MVCGRFETPSPPNPDLSEEGSVWKSARLGQPFGVELE